MSCCSELHWITTILNERSIGLLNFLTQLESSVAITDSSFCFLWWNNFCYECSGQNDIVICAIPCQTSLTTVIDELSAAVCCLVHVLSTCPDFFFLTYTGLTENLLQTEPADFDEVIEKLFGEVSALEDFPKITDPQVDLSVWESLTVTATEKQKHYSTKHYSYYIVVRF